MVQIGLVSKILEQIQSAESVYEEHQMDGRDQLEQDALAVGRLFGNFFWKDRSLNICLTRITA